MNTSTAPLKIGVAGAGVMGRNHARVAAEMREFELTTIFDPDAVTAEGVAAAYGASPVTTAQAFVEAGLDAAVVATPNRFHAEVGVALLEKGVHVLVEKPIAATVADAQRMIDAAKANDRVLMVGQVERFNSGGGSGQTRPRRRRDHLHPDHPGRPLPAAHGRGRGGDRPGGSTTSTSSAT